MAYIANKVCRFGGNDFLKWEVVPDDLVLKSKVPDLIKTGVLVEVEDQEKNWEFDFKIQSDDGEMILNFSKEELNHIFNYLGNTVEVSKELINNITSNDVLIILEKTENRKSMKEYIKNRALELLAGQETE